MNKKDRYFTIYVPIKDFKLDKNAKELFLVGEVCGYQYAVIRHLQELDFAERVIELVEDSLNIRPRIKDGFLILKGTELSYFSGQYNEYGRCEFEPYFYFKIEKLKYLNEYLKITY
jgi:hypothetical protein